MAEILLVIGGIAIGIGLANVWFFRLLVGKLKVATDPEDGQHYLFLELNKQNVPEILKKKYVLLRVSQK